MWKGSSIGNVTIATGNSPPQPTAATRSRPAPRTDDIVFMHSPCACFASWAKTDPPAGYTRDSPRVGMAPQTLSAHAVHARKECDARRSGPAREGPAPGDRGIL